MSFGIILAAHGNVAPAMLEAAEMLAGKQDRVRTIALTADKPVDAFEAEFASAYDELAAAYDHVVAVCDIYGGSPFNVISRAKLSGRDMTAFTGLNLPVLIELIFNAELTPDEVRAHAASANADAFKEIVVQLAATEDEDDLDL